MQHVAWAEHFNGELGDVNRNAAMQIPAIVRARSILIGIIAQFGMKEFEGETEVAQPWLYTTSGNVSLWHRMAWTLDDWLFYGWSAWAVQRDADDQITDGARIPYERWTVDERTGEIRVDGKTANASEVLLLPGPFEGLLLAGAPTIRGARALDRAWVGRAQNPIPLIVIQQTTDDEMEDDEVDEMVAAYAAARTSPTGAVVWSDSRTKIEALGTVSTDLFEEGRNAIVLDIARLTGLPAALLDGSLSSATLTYSTQEGTHNEFADFSLAYWTAPFESRMSMDDVCKPGRRIRLDKTDFITTANAPIAAPVED